LGSSYYQLKDHTPLKRLYLKDEGKKVTGLCVGISDYLNVDVTVIRLIVLTLIIMSGVLPGLFGYLIAAAITPKEGDK
jgi:phage shock protein PspC (stress-responsive transcriptional regulator)